MDASKKKLAIAAARYVLNLANSSGQSFRLTFGLDTIAWAVSLVPDDRIGSLIITPNMTEMELGLELGRALVQPTITALNEAEKRTAIHQSKIQAIKDVRERSTGPTGKMGLREAKDLVDAFLASSEAWSMGYRP